MSTPVPAANSKNPEIRAHALNGGLMLIVNICLVIFGFVLLIRGIQFAASEHHFSFPILAGIFFQIAGSIMFVGHFTSRSSRTKPG